MLSRTGVPPGDKCGVQRLVPGLWGRRGAPFPPPCDPATRGCAPTGRTAPAAGGAVTRDPPARPGCVSQLRADPSSLLTPRAGLREPRASPGSWFLSPPPLLLVCSGFFGEPDSFSMYGGNRVKRRPSPYEMEITDGEHRGGRSWLGGSGWTGGIPCRVPPAPGKAPRRARGW